MSAGRVTETSEDASVRTPREARERTRIGRYAVEGVIGRGGMGVVYLGRDPALDRAVAIKLLGDEFPASRLIREGQALAQISHPNVIHVYEVGREGPGLVYIAMEHVDGVTLATWLETPRTRAEILRVFVEAARGLAAAHAAGIVHRDFKPENVMIDRSGRARVLDFGLATTDDEAVAPAPQGAEIPVVGTPSYMSPEQWRGEHPGATSDQFSFCVALAHALTGVPPFGGGSRAELRAAVLAGAPRSARLARLVWAASDEALLVFDGATGENWAVALDGRIDRRSDLPMSRTGSFGELSVAATTGGLAVFGLTVSADVYRSAPL